MSRQIPADWKSVSERGEANQLYPQPSEDVKMPNTQYNEDGKIVTSEWTLKLVKNARNVQKLKGIINDNAEYREYDEKPWNHFTIPQAAMKDKDKILDDASIRKTIEDPNHYKRLEMILQSQVY